MNLAGNLFNFISGFNRTSSKFALYTMESLNSASPVQAIIFDGIMDLSYKNQINVAYEPLENSQFSSDSWQDTPYTLKITVVNKSTGTPNISNSITSLETYLHNTTILAILQIQPLYSPYLNLKLIDYGYGQNINQTIPFFAMTFQEIRTTTTKYGGLQQNQVSNPNNSSQVDTGLNAPQTPSGNTTTLESN